MQFILEESELDTIVKRRTVKLLSVLKEAIVLLEQDHEIIERRNSTMDDVEFIIYNKKVSAREVRAFCDKQLKLSHLKKEKILKVINEKIEDIGV